MLISRTPFRISFVGGATDIENYYSKFGGEVVSCAINKYIYVTYNRRDDKKIVISYTKLETVNSLSEIEHPIVKECCLMAGLEPGFEIHIISNISTIGTGLGGSSALAVGLLRVLFPLLSQIEIAELACKVEIDYMGKCIGKQDQYSCAIGGLKHIMFQNDGIVTVNNIDSHDVLKGTMFLMPNKTENRLGTEIILQEQNNSFAENLPDLHEIKKMCAPFVNAIKTSDVRRINKILSLYWVIKQKISPDKINFETQRIIEQYVNLGCGVKICGAGQGGYIFIFDNNRRCDAIAVKIDYLGTILLDNNKET